jgi:hypothetical protein
MKILSNQLHGVLDYATVIAFFLAPTLFDLTGLAAIVSYALAAIHLTMTVLTDMPLGVFKIIPIRLHALVEMLVGPLLLMAALTMPQFSNTAQIFFAISGVAIVAVWFFSEYSSASKNK